MTAGRISATTLAPAVAQVTKATAAPSAGRLVVVAAVLAVWLGTVLLTAAVVAPAAFAVLPTRALAGALVGLGFLTKTLQVLLVVPFLGIAFLGFVLGTVAVMMLNWPLLYVSIGILALSLVVGRVLSLMGYGAYTRQEGDSPAGKETLGVK